MAKRSLSDSDCEDLFSDTKDSCITPPGSETCGHVSRKKRRGIIEKRRRDRINNSLTELRRLVPTAFEKQGSAKLEKAEILQMTVDHLKMLHAKGLDALAYDPHKFAMDYHSIGFRECAAEVARYLVTTEGMDIQDPIRLRLMSHLQCFAAQRELANKQASAASSWSLNPLTPSPSYALQSHHTHQHHHLNAANTGGLPAPSSFQGTQHTGLMEASSPSQSHHQGSYLNTSTSHLHTSPSMPNESLLNHHHHQQTVGGHHNIMNSVPPSSQQQRGGYPTSNPMAAAYSMGMSHPANGNNNGGSPYVPNGKQPYRPWGGELVY